MRKKAQRRAPKIKEKLHTSEELADAKGTIKGLEHDLERRKKKVDEIKQESKDTITELENDLARQKNELCEIKEDAKEGGVGVGTRARASEKGDR